MKAVNAMQNEAIDVVVVGGANVDVQGHSFREFRPHDSNPGLVTRTSGGVGRNIAENCARLGLRVSLVSAFGDDENGRWLEASCRVPGLSTDSSLRCPGSTASYLCLLDSDGSLAGAVADMAIMEGLSPAFLETKLSLLHSASALVVDANIPPESLIWLARRFGRGTGLANTSRKPLLYFDPVSAAKSAKARGLSGEFDCMKPNLSEARVLSGSESDNPYEIAETLEREGKIPAELFISLGSRGLFYARGREKGIVGLPPAGKLPPVVNRSGAGDAALAAIVWASFQGLDARDKARMALAAAALASASADAVSGDMNISGLEAVAALIPREDPDSSRRT
jgi:pseudouridine kinase